MSSIIPYFKKHSSPYKNMKKMDKKLQHLRKKKSTLVSEADGVGQAGSSSRKQSFSTLFKMQFYENTNGAPGKRLAGDDIIFRILDYFGQKDNNFFRPDE